MSRERKSKNCAACNFDLSDFPKESLDILNLCKKHKKELIMSVCAKCGNQDMEYKSGIGKTGKQWQGYKCSQCKTMHGMNGIPWGEKPKQTYHPDVPQSRTIPQNPIEKKLDLIISMLKTLQQDMGVEQANKELQINSEEAPF